MRTSRKNFIKTGALLVAGSALNTSLVEAAVAKFEQVNGKFVLPSLGYAYNALEPFIDAKTMEIHHTKHHQAYVTKLNEAVSTKPELQSLTLEQLITSINQLPTEVKGIIRNNGGGHWNHRFFWELLKVNTQPSARTLQVINKDFGSIEHFKTQFEKAALGQFGSGWAWLIKKDGKLQITATPNQDNPLMDIAVDKGTPIIGLDVWEHAYYLNYQNRRADYVKAFWNVLNWEKVDVLIHG